jgi:RNA recognition motif-containing protein
MASGGNPQFRYTQPPSKVIHVRNLPWECTDEELAELGSPFGKVVNTKCNVGANRNQAFIEFVSITSRILLSFILVMVSVYALVAANDRKDEVRQLDVELASV